MFVVSLSVRSGRSSPSELESAAGDTAHFLTDEADIRTDYELRFHDEARVWEGMNHVKKNSLLLLFWRGGRCAAPDVPQH